MKKVGAQRPTKIPNNSAWVRSSASPELPPRNTQIAIDTAMEAKPQMKHNPLTYLIVFALMEIRMPPLRETINR